MSDLPAMEGTVSRRRYERERRAREEAEKLLEDKSRSLYEANQLLLRQAETLEAEVRRRTADLEAARAAADEANRAKSEFLAVMSHEIRTPMNGVLGMAAALVQSGLTPDQRVMLDVITSSGHLLLGVIDDILDLSKIEAGKFKLAEEVYDLAETVGQAATLFRAPAEEKGLALEVDIDPALARPVAGDPMRLGQVLNNLLSNAVKFTDAGSLRLVARLEDGQAVVAVSDSGIGIPVEVQGRLFQPFSQADGFAQKRFKGTGLGLSISRHLAEMMGGTLAVVSEAGRGATFTLRLPLRAPVAAAHCGERLALPPRDRLAVLRPRLLAVDDNATNRLVLKHLLARQPVELHLAAGGAEGLEICERTAIDLVLMDIQMPGMDGPATLRALRRRERAAGRGTVPVVAVSANAMADQVVAYLAQGFAGHIAKPVGLETLIAGIVTALDDRGAA